MVEPEREPAVLEQVPPTSMLYFFFFPLFLKLKYVYTMECHSAVRKNKIMPFAATWMQLEMIILSEVSQRKTNTIWYHLYMESKIWHKWIYLWNRNRLTDVENRLAKGEGVGRGMDWEFGVGRCKLLHLERRNEKVLLHSTGNSISLPLFSADRRCKDWFSPKTCP